MRAATECFPRTLSVLHRRHLQTRSSSSQPRQQIRNATVRRRGPSEIAQPWLQDTSMQGTSTLPKASSQNGMWAPKTRIVLGIVIIGAMIYSMVSSSATTTSSQLTHSMPAGLVPPTRPRPNRIPLHRRPRQPP